jgi:hypothetical protein
MSNYPKTRQSNLVVQDIENELLIYDLQINKAFCLNQTSAMVWQLCDGKNSVADIAELLSRKLKMDVSQEFVWLALDGLKKDNLLEKSNEFEINFSGLTRREVVKKVGLASLVTLPVIASVIAPSALMAQSGGGTFPLFSPCTSNTQCASGNCRFLTTGGQVCCNSSISTAFSSNQFVGCVATNDCNTQAFNCCSNSAFSIPASPPTCSPGVPFACFCN